MLNLILGGAASGKSEFAEQFACAQPQQRVYLATMRPSDAECRARIEKHRRARAARGFTTVECYTGLSGLVLPPCRVVLLECLSNLCANELYDPEGAGASAGEELLAGITNLCAQAAEVVVVSNEVFTDGIDYPPETQNYLHTLGRLNRALAARAGRVVEVVYGIPIYHKGASV